MADFNIRPYFDTHDPLNNYKKVLFPAGRPVQARELNELQSIIGEQAAHHANHIFKSGARVSGGSVSFNNLAWVRLNKGADISWFIKDSIAIGNGSGTGDGSEVEARIIDVAPETSTDPATLFVVYTKTGKDGEQTSFLHGEELKVLAPDRSTEISVITNRPKVRCPSCAGNTDVFPSDATIKPTGSPARQIVIEQGVWYWDGVFITSEKIEKVYSKYNEKITAKIGFDVVEEIVTYEDDPSLLDNALGYPNETAVGADRFKVHLKFTIRRNVPEDGTRFIQLATIEEGFVTDVLNNTAYADIMDTMAQRTYEESGNYTVKPFSLTYIEHKSKAIGDQLGGSPTGNPAYLRAIIGKGIGYVNGYRHEKVRESFIDVPKARDTLKTEQSVVNFSNRAYVDLKVKAGANPWANNPNVGFGMFTDEELELKDGDVDSSGNATGATIGFMKVWDVQFVSGDAVTGEGVYRYFVADVRMHNNKTYEDIKSVGLTVANFAASPADSKFKVINDANRNLFWEVDVAAIKSMREVDNPDKGSAYISRRLKLNATLDSNGAYTWDSTSNIFNAGTNHLILAVKNAGKWEYRNPAAVTVNPNSVNVNLPTDAGKDVMLLITAVGINLIEKTKTLVKDEVVQFNKGSTNDFKDRLKLGKADAIKLNSVIAQNGDDLTASFVLQTGQTPTAYYESWIELRDGVTIDATVHTDLTVKFDYFAHSDINQSGFFNIDSYAAIIADDTNDIDYGNLPTVKGYDGKLFSVAQIVDFRPVILSGGNINTGYMPAPNSVMIHDSEFYVPRMDYVFIDKDGTIGFQKGVPSINPKLPEPRPNAMMLYKVYIPAYTYSYRDVKYTKIENKRYTMRDIGRLENRIDKLEYYSMLSLPEQSVMTDKITDAHGNERYKNGFLVDQFTDYSVADTASPEFKALKDAIRRALRPNTKMFNRKLKLLKDQSTGFYQRGSIITLPYEHVLCDEQPFATKSVSINECFLFNKKGKLLLFPNNNTWSDTTREAKMEINIDTGVEAVQGLSNQINKVQKDFNDFQLANINTVKPVANVEQTIRTDVDVQVAEPVVTTQPLFGNFRWDAAAGITRADTTGTRTTTSVSTSTTTTRTAVRSIADRESRINSKTETFNFDRVTDVKVLPFMRETVINFSAEGLLPNTKMYLFFSDQNVTDMASMFDNPDAPLATDENGNLMGTVVIPSGMFLNGTKLVKITNDKTNSGDEDMELCHATAEFYAGGIDVTKQEIDLNVTSPTLSWEDVKYTSEEQLSKTTNVVVDTSVVDDGTGSTNIPNLRPIPPSPPRPSRSSGGGGWGVSFVGIPWAGDPIAQSFTTEEARFITKFDLFFHTVDPNNTDLIWLEIRKMVNGYPAGTDGALTHKDFHVSDIKVSEDASEATTIEFDVPVYLEANTEYCFVIGGWSPLTKAWVAKLGGECVNYPSKLVDTQPSLGSRFRSQNGSTWNAEQFEDIMYKMYCAKFTETHAKLTFNLDPEDEQFQLLPNDAFECERGSNFIRVHTIDGHGLVKNDLVSISTLENQWVKVKIQFGKIMVGHTLTDKSTGATFKVKQVQYPEDDKSIANVLIYNCEGVGFVGNQFETDSFTYAPKENWLFLGYQKSPTVATRSSGTFLEGLPNNGDSINGYPLQDINKLHKVESSEDGMSFVIRVDSTAHSSGRFGQPNLKANLSDKFEMVTTSASVMVYDGAEKWEMKGFKHGAKNTIHDGDNYGYDDSVQFQRNELTYLKRPWKVSSKKNEDTFASKQSSVVYDVTLSRNLSNPWVAPFLNLDTLSSTFLSNQISWLTDETKSAPNLDESYKPETDASKGSELYKYISKTITFKDPALDLKIWFEVNKPLHTDFDVYIKTSESSGQDIDDKPWVLLEGYEKGETHNEKDRYTDVEILTSKVFESNPLKQFSSCKIKIVGRSKNTASFVEVKNLRVIALT